MLVGLLFAGATFADSRYITDIIYIPMRAGPSNQYKITHQGLKTGTKMEVIDENAGNGYSKVVTPSGLQGYIRTQYLLKNPPAVLQLPMLQDNIDQAIKEKAKLSEQLQTTKTQVQHLTDKLQSTNLQLTTETAELQRIKTISADPLAIDQRNKSLVVDNMQLQKRVKILETDKNQLAKRDHYTWFLYGAGTLLIGIILGLILPRLKAKKKQPSNWI